MIKGTVKRFFNEDFRLEKINKQGDSLLKLDEYIDWEMLRPVLKKAFVKRQKDLVEDLLLIML